MDRGAWWASVHGVTKSCTRLSNYAHITSQVKVSSTLRDTSGGGRAGTETQ